MYLSCFTDTASSATPCPQVFQRVCWPQHWRGHPVSSGAAPGGCQGDRAAARMARPSHAEPGTIGIFFVIIRVGFIIRWCPLFDSHSTAILIWTATKSEIVHQNPSALFYVYAHQNHLVFYFMSVHSKVILGLPPPPLHPPKKNEEKKKKKRKTNCLLPFACYKYHGSALIALHHIVSAAAAGGEAWEFPGDRPGHQVPHRHGAAAGKGPGWCSVS